MAQEAASEAIQSETGYNTSASQTDRSSSVISTAVHIKTDASNGASDSFSKLGVLLASSYIRTSDSSSKLGVLLASIYIRTCQSIFSYLELK